MILNVAVAGLPLGTADLTLEEPHHHFGTQERFLQDEMSHLPEAELRLWVVAGIDLEAMRGDQDYKIGSRTGRPITILDRWARLVRWSPRLTEEVVTALPHRLADRMTGSSDVKMTGRRLV